MIDYTLQTVMIGTVLLGVAAGVVGTFAVLRQQSLVSDAIAHAALPGIAIAFLVAQQKTLWVLLVGAFVAGLVGTCFMQQILHYTPLKKDTAIGIILSVFFGGGVVLLTLIQRLPLPDKSGLHAFLFGQASALLRADLLVMVGLSVLSLVVITMYWQPLKLLTFDPGYARAIGWRRQPMLFNSLLVLVIVVGLQTVGVVLISAFIIMPGAAARQWSNKLWVVAGVAGFFGALGAVLGSLASHMVSKLPTGPVIVLVLTVIVGVSMLVAPSRGLVWEWLRRYRQRKQVQVAQILRNLRLFSESKEDPFYAHDIEALEALGFRGLEVTLAGLAREGLVHTTKPRHWGLTKAGLRRAEQK